jgi:hypothetical protein
MEAIRIKGIDYTINWWIHRKKSQIPQFLLGYDFGRNLFWLLSLQKME